LAVGCLAGIAVGQLICDSVFCRDAIGVLFARGHLLALIQHSRGIYESDLQREIKERRDADVDPGNEEPNRGALPRLIANAVAEYLARDETISEAKLDRECSPVQFQFRDTNTWLSELVANHLSRRELRSKIVANLRAANWIEHQLTGATRVTEAESAEYLNTHQPLYSLPARYRASHLFLAAPKESPPPIVELQRRTIDSLSVRISHGEGFSELVAMTSEDERTKTRGGDLGFFSESRMPPDFFAVVAKMQIGEISPPIRTALGFHIVQLTDARPARQLSFEEVSGEIRLKLDNEKRRAAMEKLTTDLARQAPFVAGDR
jgi:parvulin-like peptidyl-prolyl isomerase